MLALIFEPQYLFRRLNIGHIAYGLYLTFYIWAVNLSEPRRLLIVIFSTNYRKLVFPNITR